MAHAPMLKVVGAALAPAERAARSEVAIDPDKYPYELQRCSDGWIVQYPDLPGCTAYGSTRAEAMMNGEKVIPIWFQAHADYDVPLPQEYRRAKGSLRVRIPREMHKRLADTAAAERASFNSTVEKIVTEELKESLDNPAPTHSGEWVQRMSPATHHALRFEADRQGVSLNMLIVALIAQGLGQRKDKAA